jgi:hypothetical protein
MSSYMVLAAVSDTLRHILWQAFSGDPVLQPIVGSESAIVFANPTETARDSANRLSLWLYQVTENEFLKNQPPARANGSTATQMPPLALNLYYLITPFANSGEADLLLFGSAMQVLYDNAIILLHNTVDNVFEELRVVLCRPSLEELTLVWQALREPYRLSVCYQVRVTRIDSRRVLEGTRVVDYNRGYGPVPAHLPE